MSLKITALFSSCYWSFCLSENLIPPSTHAQSRTWVYPQGTGGMLDLAHRPWHLLDSTGLMPTPLWLKVNITLRQIRQLSWKCHAWRRRLPSVWGVWAWVLGSSWVGLTRIFVFTWPQIFRNETHSWQREGPTLVTLWLDFWDKYIK